MRSSFPIIIFVVFFLAACGEDQTAAINKEVYEGPVRQAANVVMSYSEETVKKVVLKAQTLLEFKNGNREFPDGLFIEFYDERGNLSSTLEANQGFYYKAENLWKALGDVKVNSLEKNQQLSTEELFWEPDKERIYTEKFVTIRLESEVIYGTGLESNQDFTDYNIKNPKGDFIIE